MAPVTAYKAPGFVVSINAPFRLKAKPSTAKITVKANATFDRFTSAAFTTSLLAAYLCILPLLRAYARVLCALLQGGRKGGKGFSARLEEDTGT